MKDKELRSKVETIEANSTIMNSSHLGRLNELEMRLKASLATLGIFEDAVKCNPFIPFRPARSPRLDSLEVTSAKNERHILALTENLTKRMTEVENRLNNLAANTSKTFNVLASNLDILLKHLNLKVVNVPAKVDIEPAHLEVQKVKKVRARE